MNLYLRRAMAVAIAVVFAVVLAGCNPVSTTSPSSAGKPAATSPPKPAPRVNGDIALVDPAGYDELQRSSSATASNTFTAGEVAQLGLAELYTATGQLANGGVAAIGPLGKYCVVVVYGRTASTVVLAVKSRYNLSALNTARYGGLTFNAGHAWLDGYRPVCDGTRTSLPPPPSSATPA